MLMKIILLCALYALCLRPAAAQMLDCGVCPAGTLCDYNTGLCQRFRETLSPQASNSAAQQPQYQPPCLTCQPAPPPYQPPPVAYPAPPPPCLTCQPAPPPYQPPPVAYPATRPPCLTCQPAPPPYQPPPPTTRPPCLTCQPAPPLYLPPPITYPATPPPCLTCQPATPPPCLTCQTPSPPSCPSNSHYTTCGTSCPLRCDQITPTGKCNMECVVGCICNDFYVQRSATDKTCVRRENCPAPPINYNDCTRVGCSYGLVCTNGQCVATTTKAPISCPYVPPATLPPNCKYEISTDSNGCRVQKLVCPPPGQCGANSVWSECSGTCYRYCDQSSKIISTCNSACQRGCVCSQGYVFQSNNRSLGCIPESQCTVREDPCGYIQCGYGQTCSNGKCVTTPTQCPLPTLSPLPEGCMYQASVDSNGCRVQKLVCPDPNPCATKQCGYGLICKDGQCVPPVVPAGPPPALPPSTDSCPYTPPTPLPSGCKYETSYDSNGCRVQKLICPTCGENEEEKLCLICDQYCDKSVKTCTIQCPKSTHCGCKSGYFRNANDKCVAVC